MLNRVPLTLELIDTLRPKAGDQCLLFRDFLVELDDLRMLWPQHFGVSVSFRLEYRQLLLGLEVFSLRLRKVGKKGVLVRHPSGKVSRFDGIIFRLVTELFDIKRIVELILGFEIGQLPVQGSKVRSSAIPFLF